MTVVTMETVIMMTVINMMAMVMMMVVAMIMTIAAITIEMNLELVHVNKRIRINCSDDVNHFIVHLFLFFASC